MGRSAAKGRTGWLSRSYELRLGFAAGFDGSRRRLREESRDLRVGLGEFARACHERLVEVLPLLVVGLHALLDHGAAVVLLQLRLDLGAGESRAVVLGPLRPLRVVRGLRFGRERVVLLLREGFDVLVRARLLALPLLRLRRVQGDDLGLDFIHSQVVHLCAEAVDDAGHVLPLLRWVWVTLCGRASRDLRTTLLNYLIIISHFCFDHNGRLSWYCYRGMLSTTSRGRSLGQ